MATFTIDANGLLSVSAALIDGTNRVELQITKEGYNMSNEQIEEAKTDTRLRRGKKKRKA